ncbi:protein of unknown function (plasmid) [Xenorhabdus nematophila AN6/1]|nr:protein of unknown function [Xenorhabdus nematophila AN6/1]
MDTEGTLPHPAFLVGEADYFCHTHLIFGFFQVIYTTPKLSHVKDCTYHKMILQYLIMVLLKQT